MGPSCHQKKVQLFGALLTETILYPVPHRHFTLGIPKMLRPYFHFNRDLLTGGIVPGADDHVSG